MLDDRLRSLMRKAAESEDPAAEARVLIERLRSGLVSREKVELAEYLGHLPARLALRGSASEEPEPELEPWIRGLAKWGPAAMLRVAIAGVRGTLRGSSRFDGPDETAIAAIEAVEAWAVAPEDATRLALVMERLQGLETHPAWAHGDERDVARLLCSCATVPESRSANVDQLIARFVGRARHDELARRWIRGELLGWALGTGDALALRPERSGTHWARQPNAHFTQERYVDPVDIVRSVSFSRDGSRVLSSGSGGTLTLWDFERRSIVRAFPDQRRDVFASALSPDGKWALSGDFFGVLRLYETETGRELASADVKESVNDVAFVGPDRAVSVADDKAARLWKLPEGSLVHEWTFESAPKAVAVSPDAKVAAVGCSDGTLALVGIASGGEPRPLANQGTSVDAVAFAPDGARVLSSGNRVLKLWDVGTGREVVSFPENDAEVYGCAFTPDGSLVACANGSDCSVKLWRVSTGELVHAWDRLHALSFHVAASPCGKRFLVGFRGGGIRLFEIPARFLPGR